MTPALETLLAEVEEAEARMTPGDWRGHDDCPRALVSKRNPQMSLLGLDVEGTAIIFDRDDARGIALLRNRIRALCGIVRAQNEALTETANHLYLASDIPRCRGMAEEALAAVAEMTKTKEKA